MQSRDLLHPSYVSVGQFRLCSNSINGGVALRMSWYAFSEKDNRGGGGTSILDWRVVIYYQVLYIFMDVSAFCTSPVILNLLSYNETGCSLLCR